MRFKFLEEINLGHSDELNKSLVCGNDEKKDEERRKEMERSYDEVYCYVNHYGIVQGRYKSFCSHIVLNTVLY